MVESFFWQNYRLAVQSSDYILKWLHQECFSSGPWGPTIGIKFTISCEWRNEGIHGIWPFWHFPSKSGRQNYTAWVPGDPTPSCFCNVISLFEKTYKFLKSNCYTFLVKQYTSLIYVKQKSFYLINWAYSFVFPRGPI